MPRSAQDGPPASLFDAAPFAGFGPSRFRPSDSTPIGQLVRGRSQPRLRQGVKEHAPKLPGVYGMLDRKGCVIYVGKAKCLRVRLLSYFRTNSRDPKAGRILNHTRRLVWEQTADEFAALLRELELIRRFRPRFNVIGQPGTRRYLYLCLGKSPAPYAYLTREPTGKEVARYGPLVGRGRIADAVRRLNDWFKLRDCPSTVPLAFADQPELFDGEPRAARCLRYDIGNCLAPCGLCSRRDYAANVRAARAFLDGRDRTPLKELTKRMTTAALELKYEQAMALRDRLQALSWLDDRLMFLRTARRGGSFVYPLTGPGGETMWYLIHRGEVQAVLREPRTPAELDAASLLMEMIFAERSTESRITDRTVDSVLLVTGWFKKYTNEKGSLLSAADALNQSARS